ncbi:MAG: DegV family protein [Clostridiales bacterium]|nr:DegV family protein [Clostridiales bacterium]
MAYIITTDGCADFSAEYMKKRDLNMIPLMFTIDGKDYYDDKSMTSKTFFGMLRDGKMSQTSLINSARFEEFFTPFLLKGLDIIHVSLSSALSGSHQNAVIAMDTLKEKYPKSKMTAVDSKAVSSGQGLLIDLALDKKDAGASYDETVSFFNETIPKINSWFTVADLNHLFRGGRLSKSSAVLGTLLSVKPILKVDDNGKLVPAAKAKGRKKSMKALVDEMENLAVDPANQKAYISHADCIGEAQMLADMVKERFGTQNIVIENIGPVVGAHGGPDTLAIFFVGEHR